MGDPAAVSLGFHGGCVYVLMWPSQPRTFAACVEGNRKKGRLKMQDWKMADRRNHGGGKCRTGK